MERVSYTIGECPILFICPYIEDKHVNLITKVASETCRGYSIINNGWKKGKQYNYEKEIADCNNLNHCGEDVVYEEFLLLIERTTKDIIKKYSICFTFILLAIDKSINNKYPNLDLLLGSGGLNITFTHWRRDLLIDCLYNKGGVIPYLGINKHTGSNPDCLNQFFVTEPYVDSMQIKIPERFREFKEDGMLMGDVLGCSLNLFMHNIKNNISTNSGYYNFPTL